MHRALEIQDILETIFRNLEAHMPKLGVPMQRWAELNALARTCKTFHDPASDLLWRTTTLGRLLRCLPRDLFVLRPMANVNNRWDTPLSMRFTRAVVSADWDRVQHYAHRVQGLLCTISDHLEETFPTLSVSLPTNIFPKLRNLSWSQGEDFDYIHLFLTSEVTTLELNYPLPTDVALISQLARRYPQLKDLRVHSCRTMGAGFNPEANAVSELVAGLPQLESLDADFVDEKALEHLGRLPNLKSLTLGVGDFPAKIPRAVNSSPLFTSLRSISLLYADAQTTMQFVFQCEILRLTTLWLYFDASLTTTEMDDFCVAVSPKIAPGPLRNLTLGNHSRHAHFVASNYLVSSYSLRLLFRFTNLTAVSIISPGGFDLTNDDLSALTASWPRIETLELLSVFPAQHPRATLACLCYFVECPELRILSVTLDCTVVPAAEYAGPISHELRELNLVYSPISNPIAAVAGFINAIFPCLQGVTTWWDIKETDVRALHEQVLRFRPLWVKLDCAIRGEVFTEEDLVIYTL
ncbi:hypothetical protein C8R43DRAFT_183837 [Mycena crocata]|nr:hypothetical protein C8R43DRAFT_183837 [Mycena crocata]